MHRNNIIEASNSPSAYTSSAAIVPVQLASAAPMVCHVPGCATTRFVEIVSPSA